MASKWQDKISSPGKDTDNFSLPEGEAPAVITLVRGENKAGNPQWAYAKIPAQNYLPFKMAEEQGNYNLNEFGEILKFGSGKEPPESIKQEMKEQYNCDDTFEETVSTMLLEAMENIEKGQEEPKEDGEDEEEL